MGEESELIKTMAGRTKRDECDGISNIAQRMEVIPEDGLIIKLVFTVTVHSDLSNTLRDTQHLC